MKGMNLEISMDPCLSLCICNEGNEHAIVGDEMIEKSFGVCVCVCVCVL